jgi:hypothetical protein
MKKRYLSPIYFVIAVYAWLAVMAFLEMRCLAKTRKEVKRIQVGETPVGILVTPDNI